MALHPTKGSGGWSRRRHGIWQSPRPWPAGAVPWPGNQRESKVRAGWQYARSRQWCLRAGTAIISCHWTPTAKGLWYQRCSLSPEKLQGLAVLCWRWAVSGFAKVSRCSIKSPITTSLCSGKPSQEGTDQVPSSSVGLPQPGCTAWPRAGWGDRAYPQAKVSWLSPHTPLSGDHRASPRKHHARL